MSIIEKERLYKELYDLKKTKSRVDLHFQKYKSMRLELDEIVKTCSLIDKSTKSSDKVDKTRDFTGVPEKVCIKINSIEEKLNEIEKDNQFDEIRNALNNPIDVAIFDRSILSYSTNVDLAEWIGIDETNISHHKNIVYIEVAKILNLIVWK